MDMIGLCSGLFPKYTGSPMPPVAKTPPQAPTLDPLERLGRFIERAESLLARLEPLLPEALPAPDWKAPAYRWRRKNGRGFLQPVAKPHPIRLKDLQDIDEQKRRIVANTRQFLAGQPANNVLLTGTRGCGKSSLVKALLNEYQKKGLRLIEVDKSDLVDLPDIVDLLAERPEKFVIFSDDLSFEAGEEGYKALKSVLDGSVTSVPDNVVIYATSNRRHLMPEYHAENLETTRVGDEIHPGEAIEEKISLSERFGLWISFYPFSQDDYLNITAYWLGHFGCDSSDRIAWERDALNWALQRGSRSGRVAWQFARDYAGALHSKGRK